MEMNNEGPYLHETSPQQMASKCAAIVRPLFDVTLKAGAAYPVEKFKSGEMAIVAGGSFIFLEGIAIPERGDNPQNPQQSVNNTPNGSKLSGSDGSGYYDIILPCGTKVSCNDVIDALGMNFNTGEAFKGLWRKGRKPTVPASYDLSKTVYYASRELKREEQNEI